MKNHIVTKSLLALFTTFSLGKAVAQNQPNLAAPNAKILRGDDTLRAKSELPLKLSINPKVFETLKSEDRELLKHRMERLKLKGGNSGGGGDEIGIEFQKFFFDAMGDIKQHMPELYKQIEGAQLEEVLKSSEVIVVDDVLDVNSKGLIQNSVAYNNPSLGVILINRARWQRIGDSHLKKAIALHEVLSLKGIEQTGYYPIAGRYAASKSASAVSQMKAQLASNRVLVLQNEAPQATPYEILRKLHEEAAEPVSIDDVKLAIENSYCAFSGVRTQIINGSVKFKIVTHARPAQPGTAAAGPLFPAQPGEPAQHTETFMLTFGDTSDFQPNFSNNPIQSDIELTSSSYLFNNLPLTSQKWSEVQERAGTVRVSVKKNNGFLTFAGSRSYESSLARGFHFAGYCYQKPTK